MSSSNTNITNSPLSDNDVISISGSLLDDVHIDFGHEEEEEDSVFDQNLMQYLDQLPIAPTPADAKYSASFVDSVLNGVEAFKREARRLNYDTNEPFASSLLDLSPLASEAAYFVEQDVFSVAAVEQPRGDDGQLYQEQEEIPIHFNMHQDDHSSVIQPASPIGHSTEYSDYLNLFNLGQDQPNDSEYEATFLAQRKAELDALFNLNDDVSKDFSSWLYYSDDDASQIHFKDDMSHPTTSALHQEPNHPFSTEYPIDSKYDLFATTGFPFEKSLLSHSKVPPPPPPQAPADFTTSYAYGNASHQSANDFLQRMDAIVTEKLAQSAPDGPLALNKYKPSASSATPVSHAKTHVPRHTRRNSSVNIAKADFMFVSSTPSSKYSHNLSDIDEKSEPADSFASCIANTSTPVKKDSGKKRHVSSKLPVDSSKRRSTVLEEVDENAPDTTNNSNTSHRYSMRARTSPTSVIRKHYSTSMKPSRAFNLGSSKKR